jgi:hypothetical protein
MSLSQAQGLMPPCTQVAVKLGGTATRLPPSSLPENSRFSV